eukprot:203745-Chlamydomonas_euryale.AAC.1
MHGDARWLRSMLAWRRLPVEQACMHGDAHRLREHACTAMLASWGACMHACIAMLASWGACMHRCSLDKEHACMAMLAGGGSMRACRNRQSCLL